MPMSLGMGLSVPLTGISAGSSLLNGLVAFWKLGEASGTREDSVGSNDLTDTNTVTQAEGKVGNAAQFTAANSEYLDIADNTAMSVGDIDFTFSGWIFLDSLGANIGVLSKDTVAREYGLFSNTGNQLQFYIFTPASVFVPVTTTGAMLVSTWYFFLAWHDSTANTINVSLNNGTPDSAANSAGVKDSTDPFRIGRQAANHWNGRIDAVGFWKRLLTTSEKAALYNAGNGREHPFS